MMIICISFSFFKPAAIKEIPDLYWITVCLWTLNVQLFPVLYINNVVIVHGQSQRIDRQIQEKWGIWKQGDKIFKAETHFSTYCLRITLFEAQRRAATRVWWKGYYKRREEVMTFFPTLSDLSQRRTQTCLKGKQGSCLKILSEIQDFAEQLCGEVMAQVEVDNKGSLNSKSQVSKTPGKEEP